MSCPIFKSPGGTPTKTPQRRMKDALPAFLTIQLLLLTPTGCWGRPPALRLACGKGQVSNLSTEGRPISAWWVSWKDQRTTVEPQKLPLVAQSKQAPRSHLGAVLRFLHPLRSAACCSSCAVRWPACLWKGGFTQPCNEATWSFASGMPGREWETGSVTLLSLISNQCTGRSPVQVYQGSIFWPL